MKDVTVLVACDREPPANVEVVWNETPVPLSAEAAAYLEGRWAAYMEDARKHGKSLFNGAVTRLIEAQRHPPTGKVVLTLGPADYKTFVVTRLRDREWFEKNAPASMAPAVGNSVLLTRGDEAFLGVRSARVSAYASRAHLIGGVLDRLGAGTFAATTAGLIGHLEMELGEEVGVTRGELAADGPRLLGVAHDEFLAQPEILWQWEVGTALELLGERLDGQEHEGWERLGRAGVNDELWERMTPVARFAWRQWSGRVKGG